MPSDEKAPRPRRADKRDGERPSGAEPAPVSAPEPEPPPPSKITPEQRDKIQVWRDEKFKDHGPVCPMCGHNTWTVLDDFVSPNNYGRTIFIGGAIYPHFMVICNTCSNVQFINAVAAGILAHEEP